MKKLNFSKIKKLKLRRKKNEAIRQLTHYHLLLKKLTGQKRMVQGGLFLLIEELRALTIHN